MKFFAALCLVAAIQVVKDDATTGDESLIRDTDKIEFEVDFSGEDRETAVKHFKEARSIARGRI